MNTDYQTYTYWFKRQPQGHYVIYLRDHRFPIGILTMLEASFEVELENIDAPYDKSEIIEEFQRFSQRTEFMVGECVDLDGVAAGLAIEEFEKLLDGALRIRAWNAGKDPDGCDDYIEKVKNWLKNTSFYEDPASTKYHEAFKHGLLYHTLRVYNKMCEVVQIPTFKNVDLSSATLCCICHDWCKIGLYEQYKRNVKNDAGKWESVDAYKRGSFPHPLGHGVASAYIAMKLIKLSEEEWLAIRWHMAMFNVASNEINEYQQSCEDYPLVHLLQFADQLSIVSY